MLRIRPNTYPRKQIPEQNCAADDTRSKYLTASTKWLQCYMSFQKRNVRMQHIKNQMKHPLFAKTAEGVNENVV